ncbi:NACHT and WD40 repeat domain-containing protein [Streptomyces eurythermus]
MTLGLTLWMWKSGQDPNSVATIAGLFASLASLLVAVVDVFRGTETPPDPAALADDLTRQLREQWLDEARARRLQAPRVLPLAWRTTAGNLTDTELRTGPTGSPVLRLRLDGRLEGRFEDVTNRLAEGFARVPNRRLVVVGEPGSGKTVLAILVTLGLLAAREAGGAVPVLLPVSSWDPVLEPLDDWIVRTMAQPYYNGRPDIPRMLLAHGLVIPVLDGLDEIPESARRGAIRKINEHPNRPLVVTCRAVEYEELIRAGATALRQAAVVEVLPVTPQDAITYLRDVNWPPGVDWDHVFARLRTEPQSPLAKALSTPLMVTSARLVYQKGGGDPTELLDESRFGSEYAIEDHLLHGMLDAAYAPDPALPPETAPRERWTPEQARRWLTFLARHLHDHRERDLAWWQLSRRLLPSWAGLVVGLCLGAGVAAAAMAWVRVTEAVDRSDTNNTVLTPLILGVAFALLNALVWNASSSRPPGRLTWALQGSAERLFRGFTTGTGLASLLVTPIMTVVTIAQILGLQTPGWGTRKTELCLEGIGICVSLSVAVGLALATHNWLDAPPARAAQVSPIRTLVQDRRSSLVSATVAGTLIAVAGLPAVWAGFLSGDLSIRLLTRESGWPGHADMTGTLAVYQWHSVNGAFGNWRIKLGVAFLLPGILLALLLLMSRAWPRFVIVRSWLALRGKLPWRLMAFLADARRREILRQAGGAFQFRHIRLQETLAGEPLYRDATEGSRTAVRRRTVLTVGVGAVATGVGVAAWRSRATSIADFAVPHRQPVQVVRFRPERDSRRGREVAFLLEDGEVALWSGWSSDQETRWVQRLPRGAVSEGSPRSLEFSADGNALIVPARNGVAAQNLNRLAGSGLKSLGPSIGTPDLIAFDSHRGRLAVQPDMGYDIFLSEVANGHGDSVPTAGKWVRLTDRSGPVLGMTFLSDGSLAVLFSDGPRRFRLPDSTARPLLKGEKTKAIDDPLYSSGNALIVSSRDELVVLSSGRSELWLPEHDYHRVYCTFPGRQTAAFHPTKEALLAAPDTNGSDIRLYRYSKTGLTEAGSPLLGHMAPVRSLDFSRDGLLLVSADEDGMIRIWETDTALR